MDRKKIKKNGKDVKRMNKLERKTDGKGIDYLFYFIFNFRSRTMMDL